MLQETIAKMSKEDAVYYMKRCVDSGLWVPDASAQEGDEKATGEEASAANELDLD